MQNSASWNAPNQSLGGNPLALNKISNEPFEMLI